jgi:hypothetical protein
MDVCCNNKFNYLFHSFYLKEDYRHYLTKILGTMITRDID